MKKFCESLREHTKSITDFKKKKKLPLTKKELKLHQDATECYICRKIFVKSLQKIKITKGLEIIAFIHINTQAQHIIFVI